MRIHEYQAKQILEDFEVPVPRGKVATDPLEAAEVFRSLECTAAVVKAQSYGYASPDARSVGLARSPQAAAALAREMIGKRFGPDPTRSRPVTRVLIEEYVRPKSQLFLAVVMDPLLAKPVMLASAEPLHRDPGTIPTLGVAREVIDPRFGTLSFQWRKITAALGLDRSMLDAVTAVASGLYRALIECECIEAEVGLLALTDDGELIALDVRMLFDRNALFRHDEIAALADPAEFGPTENALRLKGMRYVALPGRVGCVLFDTGSALMLLDRLPADCAGGLLYLTGRESAEKMAFGIGRLLREETFRSVVVELPRNTDAAETALEGLRLALAEQPTTKRVVALAWNDAAAGLVDTADGLNNVTVVRSPAGAAELLGEA